MQTANKINPKGIDSSTSLAYRLRYLCTSDARFARDDSQNKCYIKPATKS